MFFGRRTYLQVAKSVPQSLCFGLLSASLLTGCGETSSPLAEIYDNYEPSGAWTEPYAEVTPVAWQSEANGPSLEPDLAPPMPLADYPYEEEPPADEPEEFAQEPKPKKEPETLQQHWGFPANASTATAKPQPLFAGPTLSAAAASAPTFKNQEVRREIDTQPTPKPALRSSPSLGAIGHTNREFSILFSKPPALQVAAEKQVAKRQPVAEVPVEVARTMPVEPAKQPTAPIAAPVTAPIAEQIVAEPVITEPIAQLLPPQPIFVEQVELPQPILEIPTQEIVNNLPPTTRVTISVPDLVPNRVPGNVDQETIAAVGVKTEVRSEAKTEAAKTETVAIAEVAASEAGILEVTVAEVRSVPKTPLFADLEVPSLPALEDLAQQEQLLAMLSRDSSSAVTGVLTDERVNELAKTKIQQAYTMAGRGASYVAQQELIEALRMISQAKDAQRGTPCRTQALAAGLRALREAEDFAPRGTQLEAELDIAVLCASHRTPIAKQSESANLLPSLMMDRYFRYAQLQLALSVAGEPAGSMALHALGKLHSQLGRVEPTKHRLADRHAIAYQQAALLAHNQNHLAAHELGVLLATSGHYAEAEHLLKHVAARESNAVVYRNLARVQEKLGQPEQALASRDQARLLSQQGVTGTKNVQWVSPDQFAQGVTPITRYTTAHRPRPTTPQVAAPAPNRAVNPLVVPGTRQAMRPTQRR